MLMEIQQQKANDSHQWSNNSIKARFNNINSSSSSSSLKKLPFEILHKIFVNLSFSDQLVRQSVCKA